MLDPMMRVLATLSPAPLSLAPLSLALFNLAMINLAMIAGCSGEPRVIDSGSDEDTSASECAPQSTLCNGPTLWICRADGSGYSQIPCQLGCDDGACKSEACVPNRRRCLDPKLAEACGADGAATLAVCDHGCVDGKCVDTQCAAGKVFCSESGNEVQQCSVDGLQIQDVETCQYGCDKTKSACLPKACEKGAVRCSPETPNRVQECNVGQTGWDDAGVVCGESCVDGACHVSACDAGSLRCGAHALEVCKSDGTGFESEEACEWGCLDNGQGQAFCALCLPGAYACKGHSVVFCEVPQQPWKTVQECNELDTCVQGGCVKVVTLDDAQSKKQANVLLVGAFVSCWQTMKKAAKENDLCRSINTLNLSIGIQKADLIDWFCEAVGDTVTAEDMGGNDELEAAKDLMGCGGWILNPNNLAFKTPGEQVNPGLWMTECVAYEKNEIVVAPCDLVKK